MFILTILFYRGEKQVSGPQKASTATGYKSNEIGERMLVWARIQDSIIPRPTACSDTCFHLMRKMPDVHLDLGPEHFPGMETTEFARHIHLPNMTYARLNLPHTGQLASEV